MPDGTILVTGATGQVGGAALRTLLDAGIAVRALVRDPRDGNGIRGAELVRGDFNEPATLRRALAGVDTLLLTGRDGPEAARQHAVVLDLARESGVRHVVRLSALGATAGGVLQLMRDHAVVDDKLRSGAMAWTILQPHLYMQNLLRETAAVARDGLLRAPMGDTRVPLVDARDVGAAAAAILGDPAAHAGRTYRLTGPARVGWGGIAAMLSAITGIAVRYEAASVREYEATLRVRGVDGQRAFDLAHIAQAYQPADLEVTDDLAALTGRAPATLATFLHDHLDAFLQPQAG